MDNYIIQLFGGGEFEITHEEYQSILGATGLVFIKSRNEAINVSAIKRIMPRHIKEIDDYLERKEKQ